VPLTAPPLDLPREIAGAITMLIWSGWGFLVAVIVFGCSLVMEIFTENVTGNEEFYQDTTWPMPVALIIAGIITFVCDRLVSPKDANYNTLFFIPMKWWAPLLFVIALGILIYKMAIGAEAL
jgi:hypothetical protein